MAQAKSSSRRLRHLGIALVALLVTGVFTRIVTAVEWDTYTPITAVSLTNPGPNEVWLGGMFNTLTCTTSTDTDRWRDGPSQPWNYVDDSVTQWWTGSGIFRDNNYIGTSVDYNSPWIDGSDMITAYADDDYAPVGNTFLADDARVSAVANVRTVLLEVHKVGFQVGYPLYQTPAAPNVWDAGTTAIPMNEIYNADDAAAVKAAKNHFCSLMGTNNEVAKIKCRTTVALTKTATFFLGAASTVSGTWDWSACSIAAGQTESGLCSPPKLNPMATSVTAYTGESYTIAWKYINTNFENVQHDVNTTGHNLYLTYGAPDPGGTALTVQRIAYLCGTCCPGATTARQVSDGIWTAIGNNLPFGSTPTQSDDWMLKYGAPYKGECDEHARFMVRMLKLIGSTGTAYMTYASTDATVDAPESTVFQGDTWWLKFDFDQDGIWDNNFEGSVAAGGHYYSVYPAYDADTKVRLLRKIGPDAYGARQYWVRERDGLQGTNIIPYPPAD